MNSKLEDKEIHGESINRRAVDPHLWVSRYADYLYRYALERVQSEELAKDLVQETFLSALEKLMDFEGRSSEKTWLIAILKNKIYDNFRGKAAAFIHSNAQTGIDQERVFFNDDGHWNLKYRPLAFGLEDPDAIGNKEFHNILQKCLDKLPAMWLAVFVMRYMEDEKAQVICKELKVTASNFWVIIHRAKVNLRECLQKNWR
ncbi:MAG: sigma-70 family RNA polymerase sigma factor [Chitinophagaceae bacterium]